MIKLFKSKQSNEPKGSLRGRFDAIIGKDSTVQGNIHFAGGARIDGQIEGNVTMCAASKHCVLAIGPHGTIEGNVTGERVIIAGKVCGNIHAMEWLELLPGAQVVGGEIRYKTVTIFPGARILGQMIELCAPPSETELTPDVTPSPSVSASN